MKCVGCGAGSAIDGREEVGGFGVEDDFGFVGGWVNGQGVIAEIGDGFYDVIQCGGAILPE